ncbi:MAG: phospholipase [Anaerolineae bacterium]|nr:phospholipase [Anaerolineae bacterium]
MTTSRPTGHLIMLGAIILLGLTGCGLAGGETGGILNAAEDVAAAPSPTVPMPGGILTPEVEEPAASDNLWAVYFTDPVIPFDDVTTGGIEENLIWLIDNAQYSIDAAMFEFNLQNVADALIAAHNRGVQVRIVYDDEHTEDDFQMEDLIDAGIPATPDERSALMHNKFFIFDRSIVWTGSLNFTENGVYRNNNNAIAILSPQLALNYTTEFEEMFGGEFGPTSTANTPYPGVDIDGMWVETYFSPEDEVMNQLISLASEATYSIHFMAFSFTDYDLAKVMIDQAAAGVEVSGIYESRGANTESSECNTLLGEGIDVRLDGNPRTFHHKVIIIDGAIVATGSFNYSTNATESNDENLLIIHSPQVAALYEGEFTRRMSEANFPSGGECLAAE